MSTEQQRLTGHVGPVLCLRVHRELRAFSASADGTVKVWGGGPILSL